MLEDLEADPDTEKSSTFGAPKYEFVNETQDSEDSAEIPLECVNFAEIAPGQEIDETRNCSSDKAPALPSQNQSRSMEKILKSFPKPSFSFPNKKTVTFTKTVVTEVSYERGLGMEGEYFVLFFIDGSFHFVNFTAYRV